MNVTVVISGIAGLSWLLVVAFLVLAIVRASQRKPVKGVVTGLIVALVLALILNTVSAGLIFIQPQERGVVISQAGPKRPAKPGWSWPVGIPFKTRSQNTA